VMTLADLHLNLHDDGPPSYMSNSVSKWPSQFDKGMSCDWYVVNFVDLLIYADSFPFRKRSPLFPIGEIQSSSIGLGDISFPMLC